MKPLITHGLFCGQLVSFVCDRKCNKAWGNNCRRRILLGVRGEVGDEDDWEMFADHELGEAPEKSPITECDQNKPTPPVTTHNKWCVRECERCHTFYRGETLYIYTFEHRVPNLLPELAMERHPELVRKVTEEDADVVTYE